MPAFLLEIGCEEIPARMIDAAAEELKKRVQDLLVRERLASSPQLSCFDTPRRLAVLATEVLSTQSDVTEQVNGPAIAVAFKDGHPTTAALKFAEKVGLEVSRLERVATPK